MAAWFRKTISHYTFDEVSVEGPLGTMRYETGAGQAKSIARRDNESETGALD
jgi:hypothetical protein